MESKKSIKSGAGPLISAAACADEFWGAGKEESDFLALSDGVKLLSDLVVGLDAALTPRV